MKKFIVISMLALGMGSTVLAKGYHHNGNCGMQNMRNMQCNNLLRGNKEFNDLKIKVEESKVQLMKEMAKEKPDFNNVEKINEEIAKNRAKMQTIRMKTRYEYQNNLTAQPVNNNNPTK